MSDDVAIVSSIQLSGESIIQNIDEAVNRSIAAGDPLIALEYGRSLQLEGQVRGLALAKMLYKMKKNWAIFVSAGVEDDFETVVYSVNGYKPGTIDKYVRLWENVFENATLEEELKNRLAALPIGQLLLLSAAASDGDLSRADWDKVTVASNKEEVRDIVREARGERTSSGTAVSLKLYDRDGGQHPRGTLVAYQGDESIVVGYLTMDDESLLFDKAKSRLVNGAGIQYA
jgi:hypothetical protein